MTQLNLNTPVNRWVAQHPETAQVFDSLQIDYSRHGAPPLELACRERRLCPEQVVAKLKAMIHTVEYALACSTDVPQAARQDNVHSSRLEGLCVNCELRGTCIFSRSEGGVWYCEEYR